MLVGVIIHTTTTRWVTRCSHIQLLFPHQGWSPTELKVMCVSGQSCSLTLTTFAVDWTDIKWGDKPLLKDIIMVVLCYKAHHSHFGSFTWTCSLSTIMYYGELSLMPSIILLWVTSILSNSLGSHYSIDHHQVLKHYVSAMCSCWPRDGARAWSKYFCGACVVRLCSCELICFMWLHAHQFINAIFHSHLSYALGIYSWTASNK